MSTESVLEALGSVPYRHPRGCGKMGHASKRDAQEAMHVQEQMDCQHGVRFKMHCYSCPCCEGLWHIGRKATASKAGVSGSGRRL